jgi:hypothetical protein
MICTKIIPARHVMVNVNVTHDMLLLILLVLLQGQRGFYVAADGLIILFTASLHTVTAILLNIASILRVFA